MQVKTNLKAGGGCGCPLLTVKVGVKAGASARIG